MRFTSTGLILAPLLVPVMFGAAATSNSGKYEENSSARVRLRTIIIGQKF
jgi:hypothetical protein